MSWLKDTPPDPYRINTILMTLLIMWAVRAGSQENWLEMALYITAALVNGLPVVLGIKHEKKQRAALKRGPTVAYKSGCDCDVEAACAVVARVQGLPLNDQITLLQQTARVTLHNGNGLAPETLQWLKDITSLETQP